MVTRTRLIVKLYVRCLSCSVTLNSGLVQPLTIPVLFLRSFRQAGEACVFDHKNQNHWYFYVFAGEMSSVSYLFILSQCGLTSLKQLKLCFVSIFLVPWQRKLPKCFASLPVFFSLHVATGEFINWS
jgi:hypothetical protein